MTRRLALAALAVSLAGCTAFTRHGALPPSAEGVHYVVGQPYQSGGGWRYPREQFDYNETGLASVSARTSGLTVDGEAAASGAMAAGHPTLQLPCVARVTDLDTGLQVLVRVNDRGPESRGRMIALTPRVFQLLGAGGQTAIRVRVQVLDAESRRLAADLTAHDVTPIQVATVPTGAVTAEALPLPPGARLSGNGRTAPAGPRPLATVSAAVALVPLRLPEQVTRVSPHPGALYVEAGAFGGLQYAEILRARLASLGAQTSTSYDAPRERAYRVRIGPLGTVAMADALLERTTRAGVADARIVAE